MLHRVDVGTQSIAAYASSVEFDRPLIPQVRLAALGRVYTTRSQRHLK